ncbi:hypothetical protein [Campylobacter jejuni]|nr:hypothetical protein [Campylobacter jejuni]
MSDKELEIFELCERLSELLGDKEAIADLKNYIQIILKCLRICKKSKK